MLFMESTLCLIIDSAIIFQCKNWSPKFDNVSTHDSHAIFELYDSKATLLNGGMETVRYKKING